MSLAKLAQILVVITFKWDVLRLSTLELVVKNIYSYPTNTSVLIITDQADRLKLTANYRDFDAHLHLHNVDMTTLKSRLYLSQVHRTVIQEHLKVTNAQFSTVIYLEDDIGLSWKSLVSWAEDTSLLSPFGFQRGFYRTELAAWDGLPMMLDAFRRLNISTYNRTVAIGGKYFLQLESPYMGMWIADAEQLSKFMGSYLWTDMDASYFDQPGTLYPHYGWGVRELAACNMQFVQIPQGFTSAALVPYDPVTLRIDPIANIAHSTNNYCNLPKRVRGRPCSIAVDEYLFT